LAGRLFQIIAPMTAKFLLPSVVLVPVSIRAALQVRQDFYSFNECFSHFTLNPINFSTVGNSNSVAQTALIMVTGTPISTKTTISLTTDAFHGKTAPDTHPT